MLWGIMNNPINSVINISTVFQCSFLCISWIFIVSPVPQHIQPNSIERSKNTKMPYKQNMIVQWIDRVFRWIAVDLGPGWSVLQVGCLEIIKKHLDAHYMPGALSTCWGIFFDSSCNVIAKATKGFGPAVVEIALFYFGLPGLSRNS